MRKVAQGYRGNRLITPPYNFYLNTLPDGRVEPVNCELLSRGDNVFYQKQIKGSRFVFTRVTTVREMFSFSNTESGEVDVALPSCIYCWSMFAQTLLRKITISAPLMDSASPFCNSSNNLEELIIDMPKLRTATAFAQATPKLKRVTTHFPLLSSAVKMFWGSGLGSESINAILESLPVWNDGASHVITFTGCPGASACNPEIATRKGWTVEL